jgi:Flavin containing amine oxidoreductase
LSSEPDWPAGIRSVAKEHEADAVVVATDAPTAGALTGVAVPEESVGEVCIYYEIDRLGSGRKILLNAEDGAFVNNAVEMSNISEKYVPPERHLLYAVTLRGIDLPDEDLYRRGIEDLGRWYPGADFRPIALRRIPYGQFAQPPGIHSRLPDNVTQTPGLAGEYTENSSINGSMLSGEKAARTVIV